MIFLERTEARKTMDWMDQIQRNYYWTFLVWLLGDGDRGRFSVIWLGPSPDLAFQEQIISSSPTPFTLTAFIRAPLVWIQPGEAVILTSASAETDPPMAIRFVPPQTARVVLVFVPPISPVGIGEPGTLAVVGPQCRLIAEREAFDHELVGTRRLLACFFLV